MNGLDVAVALAVVASSVSGYRQGLLIRISTAVGGVGGLLLAAANLPWMEARLPFGDGRPGFVSIVCSLVVGAVLGRFLGTAVGRWLRRHLPTRPVRQADRLAGGALGAVVVGVVVWLAAPLFAKEWVIRVGSVDRKVVLNALLAVYRDLITVRPLDDRDARCKQSKSRKISTIDRQIARPIPLLKCVCRVSLPR